MEKHFRFQKCEMPIQRVYSWNDENSSFSHLQNENKFFEYSKSDSFLENTRSSFQTFVIKYAHWTLYGSGTANKMLCEFGNKYRELVGEIEKAAVQGEAQDWNSHLQNLFGFRRMRDFFV